MKEKHFVVFIMIASATTLLFSNLIFRANTTFPDIAHSMFAGFFAEKLSVEQIKGDYANASAGQSASKVKILIIPGHTEYSPGAAFRNMREVDMTVELGEDIYELLKNNDHYEVVLLRGKNGDNPDFVNFYNRERGNIARLRDQKRREMKNYISNGLVRREDPSPTPDATEDTALRLYGLNMWADEIGASIVINVHFNDYPRRRSGLPGEYSGFAIYVPFDEYGNARASKSIAEKIFGRLSKYYSVSSYPKESAGIVPDWELISLGANDTLKAPSVLIEYGYIYETQFRYPEVRKIIMRDLALKTYLGIQDFFGDSSFAIRDTALLPYLWNEDMSQGDEGKASVLALQAALVKEGLYPPVGLSKQDCPITGTFKGCTTQSLKVFQSKNGIEADGSVAGPKTREILNKLFGAQ